MEIQPLKDKSAVIKRSRRQKNVFLDIGRKGTHIYEPVKSVPAVFLVLLLAFYMLLGFVTQLVEDDMVGVTLDADVTREDSNTFSEEASRRYLLRIVGDEPRVSGTQHHLNRTQELKTMVDEMAATSRLPVHTEWQISTANFWMDQEQPHVIYYQNVSNIIAVLEGHSGFNGSDTSSSLLVNCHYDSVPYALGASDDAVFCAVMMETLSRLSRRQERFKHNVIFLFNGAEENGLQGSHGFLQHPWAKGVTSVVNLDASGMNGKATVFQVSDPRVLKIYQRTARKPQAQSFGEFLFASGMIPSDTDFRIWRGHGNLQGADIAFTKWGHVYHTRYDISDLVHPGVMQCAGDMLLNLVTDLADDEEFSETVGSAASWVYYDYLNVFMVAYSSYAAYVVDTFIVILAFLSVLYYLWLVGFRESTMQDFLYCMFGRLLAEITGILLACILMYLMVLTTIQMRYLVNPWIVVPLFWVPFLIGAIFVLQTFDAWRFKTSGLNRSIRVLQGMAVTRMYMCAIVLSLLWVPGTASVRYLIVVPLVIMSVCSMVSITIIRIWRLEGWQHLLLEVLLSLPSIMWLFSVALRFNSFILPIMGRAGVDKPDYVVGIINIFLVILVSTAVSGIELFFSRKRLWMVLSGLLAVCVIFILAPFQPYSDDGPSVQRHYWFHTEIQSFNIEGQSVEHTSGVLITKHDPYTITSMKQVLQEKNINVNIRTDFKDDCEKKVYCNLPIYRPRFESLLGQSLFLYMDPPRAFEPRPSLSATRECYGEVCVLSLHMISGTPHNMLTLWPAPNTNITSWSLTTPLQATLQQLGRPVYVLVHSVPTYSESMDGLRFNVTITVPISQQSQSIISVSHQAHRLNHPQYYTEEYSNLVNAMPKYFNIATTITLRTNYEL